MKSVIKIAPGMRIVGEGDTRGMKNPISSINCTQAAEMIERIKQNKSLSAVDMTALWQHLDECNKCAATFASTLTDLGFDPGFEIDFGPNKGKSGGQEVLH